MELEKFPQAPAWKTVVAELWHCFAHSKYRKEEEAKETKEMALSEAGDTKIYSADDPVWS